MRRLIPFTFLLIACAIAPAMNPNAPIQVFSRSHNHSGVDVYLLCGDQNATWLGSVDPRAEAGFEITAEQARCRPGLNFFLVVKESGWGYWAGPVRPGAGEQVFLVIEKYAGLSAARTFR